MSTDIEAGASLVTVGLLASEMEGAGPGGKAQNHCPVVCANCAAPLTGAFCQGCGQKAHVHRSVLHLGEEFLHGILHFDNKAWRTLPMLMFRPGELTHRYLDGQRTRFVSPLALFLFMMFLMFFVGSLTNAPSSIDMAHKMKPGGAGLQAEAAAAREAVAAADDGLRKAAAHAQDPAVLASELQAARAALSAAEQATRRIDENSKVIDTTDGITFGPTQMINLKTDIAALDDAFDKANNNPQLTKYKMKSAATKYTFLLVPLSMPFLWFMFFWKRGVTMYDHGVFVLYSLSFMALLFVIMFLLKFAGLTWWLAGSVMLATPLHMFSQLKTTYSLGFGAALWRTLGLLFFALMALALYLCAVLVITVQ